MLTKYCVSQLGLTQDGCECSSRVYREEMGDAEFIATTDALRITNSGNEPVVVDQVKGARADRRAVKECGR